MDVVLVGAGGHARDVAGALHAKGAEVSVRGVVADWGHDAALWDRLFGWPFLGGTEQVASSLTPGVFVVGIGSGSAREQLSHLFLKHGWAEAPPLVHPAAAVDASARLAPGTVVLTGAVIGVNAQVERQACVNVGAIVGHDSVLGEYSSVNPGAVISGNVTLGARSTVGANATVLEKRRIAEDVTIGAGAVLVKNAQTPGATLVGVPARELARGD